jgi:hypothetical protein
MTLKERFEEKFPAEEIEYEDGRYSEAIVASPERLLAFIESELAQRESDARADQSTQDAIRASEILEEDHKRLAREIREGKREKHEIEEDGFYRDCNCPSCFSSGAHNNALELAAQLVEKK